MSAPPPQAEDPARTRLRAHFAANPSSPALWDELWASSFAPWDKSAPSPALIDLLSEGHAALAPRQLAPKLDLPGQHIPRPRALVPGCGKGYDVRLLAGYGFDTLGVEFSGTAVGKAQEVLAAADGEGVYAGDALAGRGEARVAQGDFFDDAWWDGEGFDFIYDYTFFSALPPETRHRWAARLVQLLAPEGRLVCLEFPTYKDPLTGGPPWGTPSKAYVAYLSQPGEEVPLGEDGHVVHDGVSRSATGLERVAHFQPRRTHEIGKGTDWISIWTHPAAA